MRVYCYLGLLACMVSAMNLPPPKLDTIIARSESDESAHSTLTSLSEPETPSPTSPMPSDQLTLLDWCYGENPKIQARYNPVDSYRVAERFLNKIYNDMKEYLSVDEKYLLDEVADGFLNKFNCLSMVCEYSGVKYALQWIRDPMSPMTWLTSNENVDRHLLSSLEFHLDEKCFEQRDVPKRLIWKRDDVISKMQAYLPQLSFEDCVQFLADNNPKLKIALADLISTGDDESDSDEIKEVDDRRYFKANAATLREYLSEFLCKLDQDRNAFNSRVGSLIAVRYRQIPRLTECFRDIVDKMPPSRTPEPAQRPKLERSKSIKRFLSCFQSPVFEKEETRREENVVDKILGAITSSLEHAEWDTIFKSYLDYVEAETRKYAPLGWKSSRKFQKMSG